MKATTRIYIDAFLQNMKNVCFFTFLPVLIAKLGASAFEISLSNSLPPLFCALSLGFLTRQLPVTRSVYYTAGVLRQICFLCMALSPLLPNPVAWLLFFWACNAVVVMITSVQQPALIRAHIEEGELGNLFSKTKLIAVAVSVVGTYAVGKFLDAKENLFPHNYTITMVVGAIATFMGMSLIAKLAPEKREKVKLKWVKPYRKITPTMIAVGVAIVGFMSMGPLWTIYHVNDLQLTNLQIAMLGIVSGLVSSVLLPLMQPKLRKWGPRKVILIGCVIMALTCLGYGWVTNFYILLFINVIRGFAFSWYDVAQQMLSVIESKEHDDHLIAYFSDYQLVQNLATGLAHF
jgi:MFS family permease